MTRKNFVSIFSALLLIVAVLAVTFGQAPKTSFAQEATGGPVPLSVPGVPSGSDPLSAGAIKSQALPQLDVAGLNALAEADKAKITKALDKTGKFTGKTNASRGRGDAASIASFAATESLRASLSMADSRQRANIKAVVSKNLNTLAGLAATTKAALQQAKDNPGQGPSLADAKKLDADVTAWKAGLDADLARVMNREQMKLYQASMAGLPKLIVPDTAAPETYTTETYYAYIYNYYAYYYSYYGYAYAYYAYLYSGYSANYDYYAYYYAYYAYYYDAYYAFDDAYYAYYYDDLIDAAWSLVDSSWAYYEEYYAYVYSYYAYYNEYDAYGYMYYSYLYNYYTQYEGWYGYYYSWWSLYYYVINAYP
jgi:hypothetical protein